jgi:multidrug efflux pump subunit AcrB
MFWIVGVALIASWVVAVVFTPYLGVKLLPDLKKVAGGHAALYDTPRYNRFRHALKRVIARKWLVAGAVVALFAGAVLSMALVKKQFFPISDRPEVLVEVQMPYGTSIARTSDTTAKLEAWLARQKEAKIVTAYVGQGAPRFYLAMGPELPDPSFAKIVIRTDSQDEREALKLRLRQAIGAGLASEARARHPARLRSVFAIPGSVPGHRSRSRKASQHRGRGPAHHGRQPDDADRQCRLGHAFAHLAFHLAAGPPAGGGTVFQCGSTAIAVPVEWRAGFRGEGRHPHRPGCRPRRGRYPAQP